MPNSKGLILEIFIQNNRLKMGVSEKGELSPSFKAYSESSLDFIEIEQLCQDIIGILNKQDKKYRLAEDCLSELKKTGQLLYDHLFTKTVKERLNDESYQDLILTVDEKLITIPWELLYDGKDFLCLKFNFGRSVSTEREINLQRHKECSYPLKMLIIANPTADLRAAYDEGLRIKNYLMRSCIIKVDFKSYAVDTMYVKKNLREYDIVHFAGHCEYDPENPSNVGWLLSDGLLRMKDFQSMAQTQPLPNIIFTNACQSAKTGDSLIDTKRQRYIYSLAYNFLLSGVRHYIGTAWKLEDDFGLRFALEFYTQIAGNKSIGEALRLSRINLIEKCGYNTIAWASYILYGDPAFILFKSQIKATVPLSFKRPLCNNKRIISFCLVIFIAIFASILSFSNILPTINPSAYIALSQANRSFLRGDNTKVIDLARNIVKKDSLFLPAYKMLGDIYFRLGNMSDALRYYFDYLRFSEIKNDNKHLACAYLKIAWCYHMKGDYPKAADFYQRAIELSHKNRDRLNEADALGRLGVWNIDKGNHEKAFSLLMQSSAINQQRQHNPEYKFNLACDYFNIAYLFTEKKDYTVAREFYEKSFAVFKALKATPELSDYYFNMGEIALFEGKYQEALDSYNKGLAIDRKINHCFNLSSDYQMMGELYAEMDRFAEAENYFKESIALCKQITNLPVLASVYYDLGILYRQNGYKDKAKEFLCLAEELYRQIDIPEYQKVKQELSSLN
jgi:CHAT domain-containing protein/lipopolysaccharide biosynthesis regulator YciM